MNVFSGARSSSRSSARSRRRPCSRTSATTSTDGWPDSVTPDRLSRKFATADPTGSFRPPRPNCSTIPWTARSAFQQQQGLNVDGIVGPETFRRLEEARWRLGDRVLSFSAGHMQIGDDATALQRRLTDMGFDSGRVDGVFGPSTDHALRDFQRNVGLEPDGVCGPMTLRALDRLARTVSGGAPEELRDQQALVRLQTGTADKVIVIDPGHGGNDPGRSLETVTEQSVIDDICSRLEGRLSALGVQVLLTRPLGSTICPRPPRSNGPSSPTGSVPTS